MGFFRTELGDIEIGAGRPEAATVEYRKALDAGDHTYWVYANLAASYALLGKMDEAKPFVAETLRLNPIFTVKWYREHVPYDLPTRDEGLRKRVLRKSEGGASTRQVGYYLHRFDECGLTPQLRASSAAICDVPFASIHDV